MSVVLQRPFAVASPTDHPYPFAGSLEQELALVLRSAGLRGRQARAVATRLGWDGEGTTTLALAGEAEGYTRERVRQLETRLRRHAEVSSLSLPLTAAALRFVENAAPVARSRVPHMLAHAGLAARPFDVSGLLSAAELGRLDVRFLDRDGVLVRRRQAELTLVLGSAAQTLVRRNGAGTVEQVAERSPGDGDRDTARKLLDAHNDVIWLDDSREWFVVRGVRTPFANAMRKMLSVSGSLSLADVDEGLRRAFRPIRLPEGVLLRLCRSTPWLRVAEDGQRVAATRPLDDGRALSPLERALVEVFRAEGPVLAFSAAVSLGAHRGLNRNSVGYYLCHSPVLKTIARGRYTLRGA
jgi:hypothetical protein